MAGPVERANVLPLPVRARLRAAPDPDRPDGPALDDPLGGVLTDYLATLDLPPPSWSGPAGASGLRTRGGLDAWLDNLPEEALLDAGLGREHLRAHIQALLERNRDNNKAQTQVRSLTILGGHDKSGQAENLALTLRAGEVTCLVGPTGSGKSRLLSDIECLAQADTPTGRRILLDDQPPDEERRYALDRRVVAQISQNMNFVADLSAGELIDMHARCRGLPARELAGQVLDCANSLAGESFTARTPVTQLSGGQTRALMIADAALLSSAPVVLIDEIENAGLDRKRALDLLATGSKIVLVSTHDPLLALRGHRRLIIRNGGVTAVLPTSPSERLRLAYLETLDDALREARDLLRQGGRL